MLGNVRTLRLSHRPVVTDVSALGNDTAVYTDIDSYDSDEENQIETIYDEDGDFVDERSGEKRA